MKANLKRITRYYLAKLFTFAVAGAIGIFPMAFGFFQYSDQISAIFIAVLTYFISRFFIILLRVDDKIDSKQVQISWMMESFYLCYLVSDLVLLSMYHHGYVRGSFSLPWNYLLIFGLIVYFIAIGLQEWGNIRQMEQKTPLKPILLTSLQITGFLFSNVFCLAYGQFFYDQTMFWSIFLQGMLPTLLTLVWGVMMFTTAWRTQQALNEKSAVIRIQNLQNRKNNFIIRSTLIAVLIFIVVSLILVFNFPDSQFTP
ncbi:hypothetical protein EZS27_024341 [termite gut metagenome]|uniref:Uncharacterized protein n=1 Tax=termite gut metagenome TaxID=433724 RepID=A0A5J4QX95_9ZZZZ